MTPPKSHSCPNDGEPPRLGSLVETPLHDEVRLREEHANVERRSVDQPVRNADRAFEDRTVGMTETDEEAVVGKRARVVEEVVVRRDVEDRGAQIDDTVRRTEVTSSATMTSIAQARTGSRRRAARTSSPDLEVHRSGPDPAPGQPHAMEHQ